MTARKCREPLSPAKLRLFAVLRLSLACTAPALAGVALAADAAGKPGTAPQSMTHPGRAANESGMAGTGAAGSPAVVLFLTSSSAADQIMSNGCWARLYDTTGFGGNTLTLAGPVDVASLHSGRIAGFEWGHNFDSVVVGPKATLAVWKDENYSDKTTTFRAGLRVQDLDTKMGQFEEIKSLRLSCSR